MRPIDFCMITATLTCEQLDQSAQRMSKPFSEARQPNPPTAANARNETPGPIDSESLFAGSNRVLIEHNGKTYRLNKTRSGKLLLTK